MFRLLLVSTLLLGLVVTTPVLCVCNPADHGGMAVHSLLPHTHQHADAVSHAHGSDVAQDDGPSSPAQTTTVMAQAGAGAASLATVGAIGPALASPWQIVPAVGGRLMPPPISALVGEARPPLGPPPRQPDR